MKKNEQYVIDITGTGTEGEGVGKIDNMAVFVPYALAGEKVLVHIVKVLKNYAFAKLIEVLEPSPHRTEPLCPVFNQCGGCSMQHADYAYELEFKTNRVKDCIKRIGGIDAEVLPCVGSPDIYGYRNKGQFAVSKDGIGFYSPRSHRLVDGKNCLIQNKIAPDIIAAVDAYMNQCNVMPYDEETHTGKIRNVFIRTVKGGVMVCVVSRDKNLPETDMLVKLLCSAGATNIILNVNSKRTNVAMGDKNIVLYGNDFVTDKIDGITFEISPLSFYQINSKQTENLYQCAVTLAGLDKTKTVFDLYCGIGTISLYAARKAKFVTGVEIVPEAIENAKRNARLNNIDNAEFFCGKAEDVTKALGKADIVIVDPPRKGCDEKLLDTIKNISPEKVVYVSCNPATLARDLKILKQYGYETTTIQPFDMFPRTFHVECVVRLCRT